MIIPALAGWWVDYPDSSHRVIAWEIDDWTDRGFEERDPVPITRYGRADVRRAQISYEAP